MTKKNKIKNAFFVCCLIVFALLNIKSLYHYVKEQEGKSYRNSPREMMIGELPDIQDEEDAWYMKYHVIAHSGGGYNDFTYSNSLEAWENSYKNGNRIFDADLTFTSDHVLVLRHEWSDNLLQKNISKEHIPSYQEFMSTPIFNQLTPMSAYDMLDFMNEHRDIYVACDFKDGDKDTFEFLVKAAKSMDAMNILDRIIVSFYDYADYQEVKSIYDFKNWAIRQYENSPHNYYELAKYCRENQIPVVMVKKVYLDQGDDISILLDYGIHVFVAVINDEEEYQKLLELGVSGVVSDFIYEDSLE